MPLFAWFALSVSLIGMGIWTWGCLTSTEF